MSRKLHLQQSIRTLTEGTANKPAFNWKTFAALQIVAMALLTVLKPWQPNGSQIIVWDVSVYYTYLPAAFIYHDVGLEEDWPVDLQKHQMLLTRPFEGKELLKMSMGMAYMYAPFFAIAHTIAVFNPEIPPDGYTTPYQVALAFAGVFWAILGCYFLFLFLGRFVRQRVAVLAVGLIFIATNLIYYSFWEGAMSHASLFALVSLVLYLGERYVEKQVLKTALLLGLIVGLIILIRPIMILPILALIAFYMYRLQFNIKWQHAPLIIIAALLPWIPQMVYWHYVTGDLIYYSYRDEGFFFANPKIVEGLFSWRKGWLVYTPIMLFSLLGMWPLFKQNKEWFWLTVPLFLVYIYVIFSWWCWWYGGSYGMRTMIEFYPFLALPLAYSIKEIMIKKNAIRIPVLVFIAFLLGQNLLSIYQYKKGILHFDSMSKEAYQAIFLKTNWPEGFNEMLDHPDYEAAKKGKR